jgi:hypothetical protein
MGCVEMAFADPPGRAIVCGGRALKPCVGCGQLSTRLCDFKVRHEGVSPSGRPWHRNGTCSAPICVSCSTSLPGDKDACPAHKAACLEACERYGLEVPA